MQGAEQRQILVFPGGRSITIRSQDMGKSVRLWSTDIEHADHSSLVTFSYREEAAGPEEEVQSTALGSSPYSLLVYSGTSTI
jgi:hypothetical protein